MAKEPRRPDDEQPDPRNMKIGQQAEIDEKRRREAATRPGLEPTQQANIDNAGNDIERMRYTDPLFIEKTKPEDPSGRPGQVTRDNVNPNIPSGSRERELDECGRLVTGGIVDPASLGMPQGGVAPKYPPLPEELRKRAAEQGQGPEQAVPQGKEAPEGAVSPREGSINEPPGSNVLAKTSEDIPDEIKEKGNPTISSLEPSEAVSGDPDFTLVISGENFFSGSVIVFGQHDEPTTFDEEAGTVSTGVKPSLFAPAVVPVKVRNGPMVSEPSDFTFTAPEGGARRDEEQDPDELEDEIEQAEEEGDVSSRKSSPKRKR